MNERMRELLEVAAKHFKDASDPFTTEVLVEHNVTADECIDLSQAIAGAIRFYVQTPKRIRTLMSAKTFSLSMHEAMPSPLPDLWSAIIAAEIADEFMKETAKILSQFNTEQIGKLSLPEPMLKAFIDTANSLEGRLQFFKSCISVNMLTKIVADKKKVKVP